MIFQVKVPYTISADISKHSGSVFNDRPDPTYLAEKESELSKLDDLFGIEDSELSKKLGSYCGSDLDFRSAALRLEEDVAVLHRGDLKAICFCFPSGFSPASKLGMSFFEVHRPVADGETLRKSSVKVSDIISREGATFRRYVWTITSLGSLSQHPSYERPTPDRIEDLYFRTETQTTVGLPDQITLFFVKVNMYPLAHVWSDTEKRKTLIESVNSMSDGVLGYKNLHRIKQILNR